MKKWAEGDFDTRKALMEGHHNLRRFENLDPATSELSENDARILLANKRG